MKTNLDLFRKIICSLTCIIKEPKNQYTKVKANKYLDYYINSYKLCLSKKSYTIDNIKEIIDFCNECYEDINVFIYAEDLEYGLKELVENIINQ